MATKAKFYIATSNGWVEANFGGTGSGSFYGVGSGSSNIRTVTLSNDDGNFELVAGVTINVKFTSASSTGTMTLNVKGTGAKTIMGGGGLTPTWTAGSIISFVYDNALENGVWVMQTNSAIISGIMDVVETNSENIVELQGGMDQMQNTMGQIQEGFTSINNRVTQLENSGAVKSIGLEAPTGFSVTNSPITTSGTIKLSFATGYSLPTTASQTNWNTAYSWGNHATKGYLTQGALNDAINNTPWVSYEEQELTATQKTQVRKNIGAGTSSFSGSYTDLTNKPTIPTVNNATLTIQKNGSNVATFTANASSNATANITVPTKVSELTNDSEYTTQTWITNQGYSKLTIGTTATTAAAGNHNHDTIYAPITHNHTPSNITGPTGDANTFGPFLLANKGLGYTTEWIETGQLLDGYATQTWVNNQKYSKLTLGNTADTAAKGNHTHNNTSTSTPTSANTSGEMKFVILSSEPVQRHAGYLYIITG